FSSFLPTSIAATRSTYLSSSCTSSTTTPPRLRTSDAAARGNRPGNRESDPPARRQQCRTPDAAPSVRLIDGLTAPRSIDDSQHPPHDFQPSRTPPSPGQPPLIVHASTVLGEVQTDEKDAVLIARLTAQLRCYEPEPVDETWARLRHLGVRREQ